jgi:RNA polymerase sigma factor (sigma-70 family)
MTTVSVQPSFEALLGPLHAGDAKAASQIFQRFAQRLISLASRRLTPVVRAKTGPEDVVQSVFRSFFTRHRQGQFDLRDWSDLWTVLVVITLRKCCRRAAHYHAACRDVRREVALSPTVSDSGGGWEAVDREPSPAEAAQLIETAEQVLRLFKERERAIVQLSLEGLSIADISTRLDCSERKIYRVLERVKEELLRMQAEAA